MYTKDEAKAIKIGFWDGFKRFSKKKGRKMTSWVLKGTQIKEVQLKFDLNEKGAFVMLQIDSKLDTNRLSVFESFEKYKLVIDETCGPELKWERDYLIEGFKEVSMIYFQLPGAIVYKKEEWETYYQFLFEKMSILEEAYLDVKEVIQNSSF
ncbi:DUF4268 domain-containing protein [Labilibaculum sp. DW002]|uniref:DUF4268 domain-containing protein n=1 Tax=Paralabilibaculum antarcticum TaxID=2912572 RepID=A0ABT5VVB6_9BACT|nr:DUF4268 domain-containing protein [Labilibaculum sp. DW002]MDE5419349.1 DUF4268 domain-containing protein [Labilibaculum sp. DW002]